MDMPEILSAYFAADKGKDPSVLSNVFASDAIVHDEGQDHVGADAIRDWWLAAKAKYNHVAEPIDVHQAGDETVVRAKVSGQFPNSPIELRYFFVIKEGKVAEMGVK
ncbi:MAG: nuclear transport factor 2 family protein [Thalassospira sp.]|uniref:nuclear transport factor 2 family protein n=1 Tax=Thalassospira sp. TaxID=1912094 RepID=UPI003A8A78BE